MFHINYNSTEHNGWQAVENTSKKQTLDGLKPDVLDSVQQYCGLQSRVGSHLLKSNWPWHLSLLYPAEKLLESEALMGTGREESLQCRRLIYRLISSSRGVLIALPERCRAEFVSLCRNTDERMFWKRLTFFIPPHLRALLSAEALSVSESDNIKLRVVLNQLNCSFPILVSQEKFT